MKAKLFIGAAVAFLLALGVYAWLQGRERAAQKAREAAEQRVAAERKRKAEERDKGAVQEARNAIAEEVRLNEPERNRLQRRYPEIWDALRQRAGGDLSRCVVTASGELRVGENIADAPPPSLRARCGDSLDQNF